MERGEGRDGKKGWRWRNREREKRREKKNTDETTHVETQRKLECGHVQCA